MQPETKLKKNLPQKQVVLPFLKSVEIAKPIPILSPGLFFLKTKLPYRHCHKEDMKSQPQENNTAQHQRNAGFCSYLCLSALSAL